MEVEESYPEQFLEIPREDGQESVDFRRTKLCLKVSLVAFLLSGFIFLLTGEKTYAVVFLSIVVTILSLLHTPFAFMVLYFTPVLEEWYRFSKMFAVGKAIGIVVVLSYLLTRFRRQLQFPTPVKLMIFFWVWAAVSSIWSVAPLVSAARALTLLLYTGLMIIFVNTIKDMKTLRMIAWSLFAGNAMVAILIAMGKGVQDVGLRTAEGLIEAAQAEYGRVAFASEGIDSNCIGLLIVFSFLIGFYFVLGAGILKKVVLGFIGALFLYVIIRTESRASMACLFLVPVFTFVFASGRGVRTKTILWIILICAISGGLLYVAMNTYILPEMSKERLRTTAEDVTLHGRVIIWKGAVELFLLRPIHGWGLQTFPLLESGLGTGRSAHNDILLIATELGIIGLAPWIAIFLILFNHALRLPDYGLRCLFLGTLFWIFFAGISVTSIYLRTFWYAWSLVMSGVFLAENAQELKTSGFTQADRQEQNLSMEDIHTYADCNP